MKVTFKHPTVDHSESFDTVGAFFWCLIFGSLYFVVKRCWTHAIISAVAAICTAGFSWLIYPFFSAGIVKTQYIRNGWSEVVTAQDTPVYGS